MGSLQCAYLEKMNIVCTAEPFEMLKNVLNVTRPNNVFKTEYHHNHDLLKTDELVRLLASPHLLREEVLALTQEALNYPIIIYEVQKAPALLN